MADADRPDEDFPGDDFEPEPLDEHEIHQIEQDLADLVEFEATFRPEGYRGVAVWCQDCGEEHYYPWDMLRENLTTLIGTGESPVHEPAFAPEPARYVPWDYARGYVDALRETGAANRRSLDACARCGLAFDGAVGEANYCPRCGGPLLQQRLGDELSALGWSDDEVVGFLRRIGIPT